MITYHCIIDGIITKCKPSHHEYSDPQTPRIIEFEGIAIAQQRPRTRVIQPKGGGKAYAQIYTVNSKHKEKLLSVLVPAKFSEEPTFFYALALYQPPASWSQKKTEESWGQRKITKPDGTNILKFYEDLLEGYTMPKDQMINPTMCERYYAPLDRTIILSVPTKNVHINYPKMLKKHFIGKLIL